MVPWCVAGWVRAPAPVTPTGEEVRKGDEAAEEVDVDDDVDDWCCSEGGAVLGLLLLQGGPPAELPMDELSGEPGLGDAEACSSTDRHRHTRTRRSEIES